MNQSEPILIKFCATKDYISIRTVTRRRKSPFSFDLPRSMFTTLEAEGEILVQDCYSYARFRLIDGGSTVQIDFTWLSGYSDNTVKGFTQIVKLDYDRLAGWIWDSLEENGPTRWSMYYIDRTCRHPHLDFSSSGAQHTIREVLAVPVLRHKLTRAVRDNFHWPYDGDHIIYFFGDYSRYSFTFQEVRDGQEGIFGGLILHHHNGLSKSYYGVHT